MIIRSLVCATQMTFADASRCARPTPRQPWAGIINGTGNRAARCAAAAVHIHLHGANLSPLPFQPLCFVSTVIKFPRNAERPSLRIESHVCAAAQKKRLDNVQLFHTSMDVNS